MPLSGRTLSILGGGGVEPLTPRSTHSGSGLSPLTRSVLGGGSANPVESEPESTSFLSRAGKALETITYPLTLPKRAIDAGARAVARSQGLDVADDATTGQMLRDAAGFNPGQDDGSASAPGRIAGRAIEFGTDVLTDPLTALIPGGGNVARVAAGAMAPGMLLGAAQEGGAAFENFQQNGFTPEVAEQAFGATVGGAFGALAGRHAFRGTPVNANPRLLETAVDQTAPVPAVPISAPGQLRRPAFLDEGLDPAPSPGPEFGYGRGGIPVGDVPPAPRDVQIADALMSAPDDPLFAASRKSALDAQLADVDALSQRGLPGVRGEEVANLADRLADERAARIDLEGRAAVETQKVAEQARQQGIEEGARILGDVVQREMQQRVIPPVEATRPQELITPESVERVDMQRLREIAEPPPPARPEFVEEPLGRTDFVEETPGVVEMRAPVADRRQAQAETGLADRRSVERRSALSQELALPPEHPAVDRLVAAEKEARTDSLTGLHNKRGWEELQSTITDADQVVMMDGKQFKSFNDTYGHPAGDAVLKNFSRIVREVLGDESARQGGDEFGAVLRNATPEQADVLISKLQAKAAQNRTQYHNPTTGEVIDIPPLEVHIARGKNEAIADAQVNVNAAPGRVGGRGDVAIPDSNRITPEQGAVEGPGGGIRPGSAELALDVPTTGAVVPESGTLQPKTSAPAPESLGSVPPKPARIFDRDAAIDRLKTRGRKVNDLGSATAEGAGALKDAAEVGASYIEDYARTQAGKVPDFKLWAKVVGQKLAAVIPNVGKFLRQIYDEAVSLFRGRSTEKPVEAPPVPSEVDAAPAAPPSAPPPGKPPVDTVAAAPMGRPVAPGESPRVEAKVENVREVAPETPLSRDTVRTHESLEPAVRKRVDSVMADAKEEASFLKRASEGKLDDVDVQALDSIVAGKRQAYDTARHELLKAQEAGGDTGPQNVAYLKAALDQVATDYVKAARSDVEAGTKLARALAARSRVMEAAGHSTPDQFLKKVFRQIPDVSDQQAAEMLRLLQQEPHKLGDALNAALNPGLLDKTLEAWKAGLVSAPGTQVANVLGNVGEQVMRVGETATAAVVDRLMGGAKTRLGGEAKFELQGAYGGARKSLGQLGTELRDIFTLAPEKIDLAQSLEHQVGKIGSGKILGQQVTPFNAGRAIRVPFRLLGAFDRFFQGMGGEAELYKRAYRRAGGDAAKAEAIIKDPPADLMAEVATAKIERVFQDPNRMAQTLMQFRSNYKLAHVVLPFIQTPANIARMAIKRSPAGFIEGTRALLKYREALKSGADAAEVSRLKGEAVDKLARPLLGTGIMLTFGALAKAGGMTGSGPADPKDRNALKNSGWQPYSFVITGTDGKKNYVPFNRFEPISSLLGFAADMSEAGDAKTGNDLFAKGIGSVVQNLSSKTYLQGIADAAELINDPMNSGKKYLANLAGSAIPNVVAKVAQTIDPSVRDTRSESTGLIGLPEEAYKTVKSRIPGLSTTLPARRSGTGEVIERRGNAATRLLSPVQPSREEGDMAFSQMLVDLDVVPSAPRKEIKVKGRDVRLTDEEYEALQTADAATTTRLRKAMATSAFRRLPDESKRSSIRNQYERGRADARNKILRTPTFRRRASEVIKEHRGQAR